jgi:hypothetical protein
MNDQEEDSSKHHPMSGTSEMPWYVAYSLLPMPGARADQGECLQQFRDEARAKKFAKQIATDRKLRIRAGTMPGIRPAMQITDVHGW